MFCRPTKNQQWHYLGHKKHHGLKFQGIVTPDGLMPSLAGPCLALDNNWKIWQECGLQERIDKVIGNQPRVYLWGDPAYSLTNCVMLPFSAVSLTPERDQFNKAMSGCRITVKQGFGATSNLWCVLQIPSELQPASSPVGSYYMVSVLLTNIYKCL